MAKLMNFDAETLSSSLEDTRPRPRVGVKFLHFWLSSSNIFHFSAAIFFTNIHFSQALHVKYLNSYKV